MPRILLMNHNRDDFGECIAALLNVGFECSSSESLVQSLRSIRSQTPDMIILNPLLLDPSGVELEQVCRARGADQPIPLLLVIRDPEGVNAVRLAKKALGEVQDFLLRPFTPEELIARVELILLNKHKLTEAQGRAKKLEGQLITDFKTNLFNDRHFDHRLREEFGRATRHSTPLTCLLIDIDNFKQINDENNYEVGDRVLKSLADTVRKNIRVIDFPARIGGDEFVVLLPHTTMAEGVYIANRIREAVGRAELLVENKTIRISISLGVSTYNGRGIEEARDLLGQSNAALKEAKSHGKNRIWVFSDRLGLESGGESPSPPQEQGEVVAPEEK